MQLKRSVAPLKMLVTENANDIFYCWKEDRRVLRIDLEMTANLVPRPKSEKPMGGYLIGVYLTSIYLACVS